MDQHMLIFGVLVFSTSQSKLGQFNELFWSNPSIEITDISHGSCCAFKVKRMSFRLLDFTNPDRVLSQRQIAEHLDLLTRRYVCYSYSFHLRLARNAPPVDDAKQVDLNGALDDLGSGISYQLQKAGMVDNTICELLNLGFNL